MLSLLLSTLLNVDVVIMTIIIIMLMMMITCMRSMVGRAGEGEEEQAVVRVPRLVRDCVSRHARLVIIIMVMIMVMMRMRVAKLVRDCVSRRWLMREKVFAHFCST